LWLHPDGKHAYISTIGDRIYAVDVTDPSHPAITDSVVVDARIVNDVMTTEDGKFGVMTREGASTRKNGIVILSFEDPAHPKPIAEFTETVTGGVHSTYVYKGYVYLTDDATGAMRVIDLRDPYHPRSEEHTSELQSRRDLVCRLLREKKKPTAGKSAAMRVVPQELRRPQWGVKGFSYREVVQGVFDRHCISCHNEREQQGKVDLSGGLTDFFNVSYDVLCRTGTQAQDRWLDHGSPSGAQFDKVRGMSPWVEWIFSFNGADTNLLLHSFPTRRSSD